MIAIRFAARLRRELGSEPAEAVVAVKAVTEGNLARGIAVRPGDKASIMAELAHLRDRLTVLVAQVRHGIDRVATASTQIASGNADLSSRSEQQAADLQQTAQSMRQITASAHTNAHNARAVNHQMAAGVRQAAQRDNDVVT